MLTTRVLSNVRNYLQQWSWKIGYLKPSEWPHGGDGLTPDRRLSSLERSLSDEHLAVEYIF